MKYLYLIPIVLILIISNIGSIYAQEDLKQEEASAGDILLFIKGKGLLELPKYLKENKKIFPTIHNDYFYQQKKLDGKEDIALGISVLKELKNISRQLPKTEDKQFLEQINKLIAVERYISSRIGYRNCFLGVIVRIVIVECTAEKFILGKMDTKEIIPIVDKCSANVLTWKGLYDVLENEFGKKDINKGMLTNKSEYEAFNELVYHFYEKDSKKLTKEDAEEIISPFNRMLEFTKSILSLYNNSNHFLAVIEYTFHERMMNDILYGLMEMKDSLGDFPDPDNREEFISIAEKAVSALKNKKIILASGNPYEASSYWKMYREIKREKMFRLINDEDVFNEQQETQDKIKSKDSSDKSGKDDADHSGDKPSGDKPPDKK